MSKRHFTTLIFLLTLLYSQAQSLRDKRYVSLQFGPSFPIGSYANKNLIDPSSGVAITGEAIKLSYISLLGKKLGIAASLHGQRNPLDAKPFEAAFTNTGYSNWKLDKASWWLGSLLVGGYGQFVPPEEGSLSFTSKAMIGLVWATSPRLNGNSSSPTATAQVRQTSKSAIGLSYVISGGVRYNLSKRLCLLSDVEYFGTPSITFENVESTFTAVRYQNGNPTSFEQQTSTVNSEQSFGAIDVTVGVGLRL